MTHRFETLRARGERALVCFVIAGDPSLDALPDILETLAEAGTDVIEIGIPFSDPIADGPTIQASSQRALDRGVTPQAILDAIAPVSRNLPPLVLMGYTNTAMRPGFHRFAQSVRAAGVSGVILSDLIPEEAHEWTQAARGEGLDSIFLVAPTSTQERIRLATQSSTGFVYCVSRTGVTGAASEVPPGVVDVVRTVNATSDLPVCVGFGVSKIDHVAMVCKVADGAVVGSALVELLATRWEGGKGAPEVARFVSSLKLATIQGA
ncbi:MAG: tryptophan synthase subunit alpha [Armatimonadota bacterium]